MNKITCEHNLIPYEANFGVMESWRNKCMHLISPPDSECTKCGEKFWEVKEMRVWIGLVDKPNKNGRTYPRAIWESVIEQNQRHVLGMLDMPRVMGPIDPTTISHKVENLRIEGDYFVGDVTAFDTPQGKILQSVFHDVDFRVAGSGTVTDGVVTDFTLHSINAVRDGA